MSMTRFSYHENVHGSNRGNGSRFLFFRGCHHKVYHHENDRDYHLHDHDHDLRESDCDHPNENDHIQLILIFPFRFQSLSQFFLRLSFYLPIFYFFRPDPYD
eukprot:UN09579